MRSVVIAREDRPARIVSAAAWIDGPPVVVHASPTTSARKSASDSSLATPVTQYSVITPATTTESMPRVRSESTSAEVLLHVDDDERGC